MLTGSCHCGKARWTLQGDPGRATACNCTLCRRSGALWAYDYENERIAVEGPTSAYTRADEKDPALEVLFCSTCAGVVAWRGLRLDEKGRRRMAVNLRLAEPGAVAAVPVEHLDGFDTWRRIPKAGDCVGDLWF
ncbi:MAG TPA: GFA family protein [Caulobacteraceae bacterium]|jgi:hypothetical protein|nr:GFA family protein [Caulobacteraceae bacterium]